MGVGLFLTGTYASEEIGQSPDDWLEQVASWIESHEVEPLMLCESGTNADEQAFLSVQVHPGAEAVEITVPEAGFCVVLAKTSTVGPGYHIFLCDFLHALGTQFRVDWDSPSPEGEVEEGEMEVGDETGYFFDGDADAVRQEMLRWLSALARVVLENCKDNDVGVRMVSMPLDYAYPDRTGILTPTGPRDSDWFAQLVESPERGLSFFLWWTEGVGAEFFLGRALCRLWQDTRWRVPVTEDEGEALMDIHLDLERAFHLDPDANIPWREWRELLSYLTEYFGYAEFQHGETLEEEIERRSSQVDPTRPVVGYRRGSVQAMLTGGWSLVIPGDMAEEWEENGETWSAWLGGRTIWFTSWSVAGENDQALSAREILDSRPWPEDGQIIEHEEGELVGRAVFLPYEEEGEMLWNLKGYSAIEGTFALCNIYLQDENDLEWALQIWKSMRN